MVVVPELLLFNVYIAENSDFTDFPAQTNPCTSTQACQHPHSVLHINDKKQLFFEKVFASRITRNVALVIHDDQFTFNLSLLR